MISYKELEKTLNSFLSLKDYKMTDNLMYWILYGRYIRDTIKLFEDEEIISIIEVTESNTNLPGIIYLWAESGREIYREIPKTDDCEYNFLDIFFDTHEMKNLLLKALYRDNIENRL